MTATEYVILVDAADNSLGTAEKLAAHQQNQLHRAFSVFVFRREPKLQVLLQQRAFSKYHSPGLWTNTCCSHPRPNEDIIAAGERRLFDELGINVPLSEIGWFHYQADFVNGMHENENDHVLIGFAPADINVKPNPEEVHTFRWITLAELRAETCANPQQFTIWLNPAIDLVEQYLAKT